MKKNRDTHLAKTIQNLPHSPGVYQFLNKAGQILYVGKAKNLKKRVSSYFNKQQAYGKTRILVSQIDRIETIVVETEFDALILENNLIKKYQPKYNIALKDDKTYPWICLKKEPFPRVFSTRRTIADGSEYFGPYASLKIMHTVLQLIKDLYPLRNCTHHLSPKNIQAGKFSACLEFHIGNCAAPCIGQQSEDQYKSVIQAIRSILKGNFGEAKKFMYENMMAFSQALKFEEAQRIKEKIEALEKYQAKSTLVNIKLNNVDVFSILSDEAMAYVNFLKINNGAVVQSYTAEVKKKLEEEDETILAQMVVAIREKFASTSRNIYLSKLIDVPIPEVKISCPQKGDKYKLIAFSLRNARYARQDRLKHLASTTPSKSDHLLKQMQQDLRMPVEPIHIECFDNSNIQGTNPVAACVVFKNGEPSKREYRHYKIKTVEGPDDFASMKEVVYRRYKRLLDENQSLPQLIIIDGGKGQLNAALDSLEELKLRGKISILGIAKRLEEIFFPDDPVPLYLDKNTQTLKIIQQLRNEAHRFGINFHRQLRSNGAIHSELEDIKGIGEKTQIALLKHFKSIPKLKQAPLEAVEEVIGKYKALLVYHYFHKN